MNRRFGSMQASQKHTYELTAPAPSDSNGRASSEGLGSVQASGRHVPTSDVEIGGGGVARPVVVGGHTLVLALVRLFALLYLESSWLGTAKGATEERR